MIDLTTVLDWRSVVARELFHYFSETPWTPKTKPEAKRWFQANVSTDLLAWHVAWDDTVQALYKTPSGAFMKAYDEYILNGIPEEEKGESEK